MTPPQPSASFPRHTLSLSLSVKRAATAAARPQGRSTRPLRRGQPKRPGGPPQGARGPRRARPPTGRRAAQQAPEATAGDQSCTNDVCPPNTVLAKTTRRGVRGQQQHVPCPRQAPPRHARPSNGINTSPGLKRRTPTGGPGGRSGRRRRKRAGQAGGRCFPVPAPPQRPPTHTRLQSLQGGPVHGAQAGAPPGATGALARQ
jgi:hypothetical protein